MKIALTSVACAIGLAAVIGQTAYGEEPAPSPPAHNDLCVDPGRIDHLSYPDDKTILFHMNGGHVEIWRNDLPRVVRV